MAIFGQYTGQRVGALPSGFLGAAMQQAAATRKSFSEAGTSIGDAIKGYYAKKEEHEFIDPQLIAEAGKALETRRFLEGDKAGPSGAEESGPRPLGGERMPRPGEEPLGDTGLISRPIVWGREGKANAWEAIDPTKAAAAEGASDVSSMPMDTLYEIVGDKKLVDQWQSGDMSLAAKKGLYANLKLYNARSDDVLKRMQIGLARQQQANLRGEHMANITPYARQQGADRLIPQPDIESERITILSPERQQELSAKWRAGTLSENVEDEYDFETARGMGWDPRIPPPQPDMTGFDPDNADARLSVLDSVAKISRDKADLLQSYLSGEKRQPRDFSGTGQPMRADELRDRMDSERKTDTAAQSDRDELAGKLDYYNQNIQPAYADQWREFNQQQTKFSNLIAQFSSDRDTAQGKIDAFNASPPIVKLNEQIARLTKIKTPANADNIQNLIDRSYGHITDHRKKAGIPAIEHKMRVKEAGVTLMTDRMSELPEPTVEGAAAYAQGYEPEPIAPFQYGAQVSEPQPPEVVPGEMRDMTPEEKLAQDMSAYVEAGGQLSNKALAGLKAKHPNANVVARGIEGLPGAVALYTEDGKFIKAIEPPTMSAEAKATLAARTVLPYTGWTGVAPSKEEAVKFRALNSNNNDIQDSLDSLLAMAKEGQIETFGPKLAEANALRAALVGKMRIPMTGGGPLTEEERKYISDNLMTNPYSATTLKGTSVAQLEKVKWMMNNAVNRTAEGIGLSRAAGVSSGQPSAPPAQRRFDQTGSERK